MARSARFAVALSVLLVLAGGVPAVGDRTQAGGQPGVEGAEVGPSGVGASAVGPSEAVPSVGTQETQTNETTTGQATTDQATDDETVEIVTEGFDPDYDPAAVLRRVEELRELSATGGITLHEYDAENRGDYDMRDRFGAIRPAGARALQLYSNASTERRQPLGYTVQRQAAVHIYLLNASDLERYDVSQEVVVAHEFVHALQFQHELLTASRKHLRSHFPRWTTDTRLVTAALVEGDAMWVTEQYLDRYGGGDYSIAEYNRTLTRSAWPHSVAGMPYYYGYEFYEEAGSSPETRSAAIERPLNATAELLHPGESVERAPLPAPPEPAEEETLTRYHSDTVGELVVRHALRMNGLSFSRSAEIADGWANDRMYYFAAEGARGPATHWATVWESASEAREFADGWRAMLDENGARTVGDDALFVPASDESPGVYYVVEREGSTVRITAAPSEELAERLAETASE